MYIAAKEVVPCDVVCSINSGPFFYLAAEMCANGNGCQWQRPF